MLPYADLPYFVIIFVVAFPVMIQGARGRPRGRWILAGTAIMSVVHFGPRTLVVWNASVNELAIVAAWVGFQVLLVTGFARWRRDHRARHALAFVVFSSIAPLIGAKLFALSRPGSAAGFLGLSYLTFRAVDALIVIGDRLEPAARPGTYVSYLLFPPTVSSGPIDRYRRFATEYGSTTAPATFLEGVDAGVAAIFRGLLYKFVLAALIQGELLNRLDQVSGVAGTVAYMYCYSGFLFFDFAGYSAIAVGISRQFGITTPENFNRPFLASDIAEFWNRWHISLSSWFRDHVYMRFVMAAMKGRWFRGNRLVASSLGLLLTFALMGAWHGLELRYLVYGGYHGVLLMGHQLVSRWTRRRWPQGTRSRAWHWLGVVVTVNAVCFGFLIFSGRLG